MKRGRVAFFGLGIMGLPMATRLIQAGFEVRGFDPDARQVDRLTAIGGAALSGPQIRRVAEPIVVDRLGHAAADRLFDILDDLEDLPTTAE